MKDINQTIVDLKQKRKKVVEDQKAIYTNARNENRNDLNADELAQYNIAEENFRSLDQQIRHLEELKAKEERLALDNWTTTSTDPAATQDEERTYTNTFDKYLRYGVQSLDAEERSILQKNFATETEKRTQTVTTTGGGYAIPQGFAGTVERILKYYGPMMDPGICGRLNTSSGNTFMYPTLNDTSNTGRLLAINTQVTTTALTFGQVQFDAFKYSADQILVPIELLEDEDVNLESIISEAMGERLGRIMNTDLTTGDGSGKPRGVVTASAAGKTASAQTAFTRDEIIDLIHSVDRAYRMNPRTAFMMNDAVLAYIKKLTLGSGDDRPLWQPSIREGEPDRLEGFAYHVNNDMASSISAGAKVLLFGDFSKYLVRRVGTMRMRRLDERYADYDQVGYVAFMRIDGDLIATGAIKHLIMAA